LSLCSSFILLEFNPSCGVSLVFRYSYQSLLFNENINKLLGRFLDLFFEVFLCISESRDVSCWGCSANSALANC